MDQLPSKDQIRQWIADNPAESSKREIARAFGIRSAALTAELKLMLREARGTGLGAGLMRAAVDQFRAMEGVARVKLGAQTHALGFYEKLGFTAYGPEFDDAGIPHRAMVLQLDPVAG